MGMDNNILTQKCVWAVKNLILIVELAKQLEDDGRSLLRAMVEAAKIKLRKILMTSFDFILGVAPSVVATGFGAELRQDLGVTVLICMLGLLFFLD